MSGRKCISIFIIPSPWHDSHLPPLTLKLNLPGAKPRILASLVCANTSRISVNSPVYVAGFERGVLPIGDWSMFITLSRCSMPSNFLCLPAFLRARLREFASFLYSISFTSELFPEPDTPVTHTNLPSGISTFTFLRLFSSAPFIYRKFPLPSRLFSGTGIIILPLRYWPVMLFLFFIISLAVPSATISPPWTPAPGPISTI